MYKFGILNHAHWIKHIKQKQTNEDIICNFFEGKKLILNAYKHAHNTNIIITQKQNNRKNKNIKNNEEKKKHDKKQNKIKIKSKAKIFEIQKEITFSSYFT